MSYSIGRDVSYVQCPGYKLFSTCRILSGVSPEHNLNNIHSLDASSAL